MIPDRAIPDHEAVERFYDDNTGLFLGLGQSREGAIHRAVWGPGVKSRADAMAYVDELIMARVPVAQDSAPHIIDFGCGVGASLCRIANRLPVTGTGITISETQRAIAETRMESRGLGSRLRCQRGDFCDLPPDIPQADLIFAIESFVHATNADAFFRQAAALLRPGGKLIICDDFLERDTWRHDRRARPWLRRFETGWVVGSLLSDSAADALAATVGLTPVEKVDLTAYLELGRPRDLAVAALMRSLGWLPVKRRYWSMLYGGHALQVCLGKGWLKHQFLVWEK